MAPDREIRPLLMLADWCRRSFRDALSLGVSRFDLTFRASVVELSHKETTMTPLEVMALAKSVSDSEKDEARDAMSPGTFLVDFYVHVRGSLKVGDDCEVAPTARAMSLETVATALYFAGATRERAIKAIMDASSRSGPSDSARDLFVSRIASDLKSAFSRLPKEVRRGQVRAGLIAEKIETGSGVMAAQPEMVEV